jgi:hypothetical protein
VYAQNLSERAILDGIRAGHVFVDLEGTVDRGMEFSAEAGGQKATMGDNLHVFSGQFVDLHLKLLSLPGAIAELLVDGAVKSLPRDSSAPDGGSAYTFHYMSDGRRHWIRANVRSADGKLLLLGNPIYLNF